MIEGEMKSRIYKETINIFLIVFDINLCLLDDENYKSDDNSFVKARFYNVYSISRLVAVSLDTHTLETLPKHL